MAHIIESRWSTLKFYSFGTFFVYSGKQLFSLIAKYKRIALKYWRGIREILQTWNKSNFAGLSSPYPYLFQMVIKQDNEKPVCSSGSQNIGSHVPLHEWIWLYTHVKQFRWQKHSLYFCSLKEKQKYTISCMVMKNKWFYASKNHLEFWKCLENIYTKHLADSIYSILSKNSTL